MNVFILFKLQCVWWTNVNLSSVGIKINSLGDCGDCACLANN